MVASSFNCQDAIPTLAGGARAGRQGFNIVVKILGNMQRLLAFFPESRFALAVFGPNEDTRKVRALAVWV